MLASLLALAAATGTPIAPSGPWNIEGDADLCLLSRQYGQDADRFVIGFQPLFDRERFDLVLMTPASGSRESVGTAIVTRQPDGRRFEGRYATAASTRTGWSITRISLDNALFAELADTTALRIDAGRTDRLVQVVHFAKARPAFETCQAALLKEWGVEPADLATGQRPTVKGNIMRYFSWQDYPAEALANGFSGRVAAVMVVDETGRVRDCRVVSGAGKLFNETTCRRASLIAFRPGTNAAGRPVTSIYTLLVSWQL